MNAYKNVHNVSLHDHILEIYQSIFIERKIHGDPWETVNLLYCKFQYFLMWAVITLWTHPAAKVVSVSI